MKKTKDKIYDTALELFRRHGYDAVTIKDICHASGVSVGLFYYHFKSKDTFVSIVHEDMDRLMKLEFNEREFSRSIDAILYIAEWMFSYAIENGINSVILMLKAQISQGKPYAIKPDRFIHVKIKELVRLGIESKEFNDCHDVEDIENWIMRAIRGVAFDWCMYGGTYDLMKRGVEDVKHVLSLLHPCYIKAENQVKGVIA